MKREDFADLDAWARYKFERESKNEEIDCLRRRLQKAQEKITNLQFCYRASGSLIVLAHILAAYICAKIL